MPLMDIGICGLWYLDISIELPSMFMWVVSVTVAQGKLGPISESSRLVFENVH